MASSIAACRSDRLLATSIAPPPGVPSIRSHPVFSPCSVARAAVNAYQPPATEVQSSSSERKESRMKIHEYQGKEILRKFGVAVPRGKPVFNVDDAVKAAEELGGPVWGVKAKMHAGGRGKGGGVKVAKSLEQVREYSQQILGMQLQTHQTGPEGQKVNRLLIEEGADIKKELYVGLVIDRVSQNVVLMASSERGMAVEEVAEKTPELIHKIAVDPATGLKDAEAEELATKIGVPAASLPQADRKSVVEGKRVDL